tara:strand:+ start:819 stop:1109 length:291 start_codon:yes stop_codon:yes gene_type:complete
MESTVILPVFTLSVIFILVHLIFITVFLIYIRKRFVKVYGRIFDLETRLNYHAVALAENELVPMPWEIDELEDIQKKIKLDKEDNVVYIRDRKEPE